MKILMTSTLFFFLACGVSLTPPSVKKNDEPAASSDVLGVNDDALDDTEESSATNSEGSSSQTSTENITRIRPSFLVIHEFLYDLTGADGDGKLFVELFGTPGTDVSDYQILFINGDGGTVTDTIKIPLDMHLRDNGLFVIADAKTGTENQTYVENEDYIDNFDPQNGPECLQLLDDQGALLDAVGYGSPLPLAASNGEICFEGTPAEDVSADQSLSRRDGIDTDDNAADFLSLDTPSPGFL
ncbi:MAG: hypothetical protein A3I05_10060 [Deltaproteobacteria bacterium RIFCSPLOWO2_02_FULL_44_10]|nr:MAG: hypothetical protein A3C46_08920 [Deltaproteobacteria bacterium RIFCSPHIGHO2_02_FULL_44_16]OGQ45892.1 MAG: hypothetical protein A3I05_10060 [Deltaproteobacteria bacterium RIFCSPLOWO2_02_FULL_44_10]